MSTILIPPDATGKPGALIDGEAGTILLELPNSVPFPIMTDVGASNTDGILAMIPYVSPSTPQHPQLWSWAGGDTAGDFTQVGTIDTAVAILSPIRAIGTNFWIADIHYTGTPAVTFRQFNGSGVTLATKTPVAANLNIGVVFTPSNDESTAYYCVYETGSLNQAIKRYDLSNDTPLSDLVANLGNSNMQVADLWTVVGSTDIIAMITEWDGATVNNRYIRRYTASGSIVYTVKFGTIATFDQFILESGLNPDGLTVWARWPATDDPNTSTTFTRLNISDGSTVTSVAVLVNGDGAPCTTCPVLILSGSSPQPTPVQSIDPTAKKQWILYRFDLKPREEQTG